MHWFLLKNIHIEWAKVRVRVGQGFGKSPVLHWILDWRALSHDLLLCLARLMCVLIAVLFKKKKKNRPMAKEKGLTVIVDSRKSSPSELCLSALKLFKVSQCTDCLWSSWHFILILNLFFLSVCVGLCLTGTDSNRPWLDSYPNRGTRRIDPTGSGWNRGSCLYTELNLYQSIWANTK